MKISWLLDKKVDIWQSYIDDNFSTYKNNYSNLRIDLLSGEKKYGNKIPSKFRNRLFSFYFSKTKFKSYYNYIWLKKNKVDVLHLKRSYLFPLILSLLQFSNRPKVVITLRGSDTYLWPWVSEKWKNFYLNKGYGIDAFVVQSKDQMAYAIKQGLPEHKISIIPASISKYNNKIIPKVLNNNKKIRFISVHRFTWQKNIQGNLLFIKKISESVPNIEYNIFGKGDNLSTSEIYYLADRLGLSEIIKVKGTDTNKSIRKELRSYHYILQLSLSESLGVSILEAMQLGVVPIVSNIGGLKDIVENNVNGIINDYFKIDELVKSTLNLNNYPSQYKLMSENCINFVNNHYDNYNESQKLNSLYKSLVKPT